jgi:AcrR family transcriptional regulator
MASDPPASHTRAQILDAAEAVVVREGVRNFTLDAVAAQSGISQLTLFGFLKTSI